MARTAPRRDTRSETWLLVVEARTYAAMENGSFIYLYYIKFTIY